MRIPYPERVPLDKVAYFALVLFVVQWLEGTYLYFCVGSALFILLTAVTFNAAGGLTRASGAYVFFYSLLVVIIGLCYKAFVGEPAQLNLSDPLTDIEVYVGSMVGLFAAVILSRRFTRRTGLLQGVLKEPMLYRASVGCILFGALAGYGIGLLGDSGRQLQTAFNQVNQFMPVGIIIGVIYEIRRSGGTRCTNLFVLLGAAMVFFLGATAFSKQGMFEPFVCMLLPIWALRYRLSIVQVAFFCFMIFVVFYDFVPVSQVGRGLVTEDATLKDRAEITFKLLTHPTETHRDFITMENNDAYMGYKGLNSYYSTPQGFWERLQFISVDDALNNFTDQNHTFGLMPIKFAIFNVVPHFLWPDKPEANLGNIYAHEITGEAQGEGDVSTGISFSPTGEAYHLEGWAGIFLLAPLLWFMLFTVYDALLGDLRATPWGMLAVVMFAHSAPEGGITFTFYMCSIEVEALVFCAFFAAWFAPALATIVLGPERMQAGYAAPIGRAFEPPGTRSL